MHTIGPLHVAHGPRLQYWVEKRVGVANMTQLFVLRAYVPHPRGLKAIRHCGSFPDYEAAVARAEAEAREEKVRDLIRGTTP